MKRQVLVLCLVCLMTYAQFILGEVHHIKPSLEYPCPQNSTSCLTLSEFVANSSRNETDIALFFLPGNHTLIGEISVANLDNFTMAKKSQCDGTVFIKCTSQFGRFDISVSVSATIKDLHFIGCGGNRVSRVTWFTVEDSTFKAVDRETNVLVLNEIAGSATIVRSSFMYNQLGRLNNTINNDFSVIVDYVYLLQNTSYVVLNTASSNVSIVSSKFMHNRAEIGGVFVALNSSVHIQGSMFHSNRATFGGVMVTSESTVDVDNSTFIGNFAQHSGGVVVTYSDTVTICGSTFIRNYADVYGGVITAFSDSSLTTSNCNFTTNNGTDGGTVSATHNSSFTISDSAFTSNRTSSNGGAIVARLRSSVIIQSCIFTDNSAANGGVVAAYADSSFTICNSTFTHNRASRGGGAIQTWDRSSFNVTISMFTQNSAAYYGGALATAHESSFNIYQCSFTNNSAGRNGGAVTSWGSSSVCIFNSIFSSNVAYNDGGVIQAWDGSSFNVYNCTFTQNSATDDGGVMAAAEDCSFSINYSSFTNNSAKDNGGVIASWDSSSLNISYSTFAYNTAYNDGGAIQSWGHSSFTIYSDNFTQNRAFDDGGVMATSLVSSFNISQCSFTNNDAKDNGGVIASWGSSSLNISYSTFTYNMAYNDGGVIQSWGHSSFTIYSDNFIQNSALDDGGVMATSHVSSFNISQCSFTNNDAKDNGGVIASWDSSSLKISYSTFTYNMAYNDGGVIQSWEHSSFTIYSDNFTQNSALDDGGVMATSLVSSFNISQCSFTNNDAKDNGGVIASWDSSSLKISYSNFANNKAKKDGGAIVAWEKSSFETSSCNFTDNSAEYGGAISMLRDSSLTDVNGIFANNSADYGGAVAAGSYKADTYTSFNVSNGNFTNNTAHQNGGVIWYIKGKLTVENSTFTVNRVDSTYYGGIVLLIQCDAVIANTMFNNNIGSLYTFNSVLNFVGSIHFDNCTEPLIEVDDIVTVLQEGGALTSIQSTINFTKESQVNISNNKARYGGAILASESQINVYGNVDITDNRATNANSSGGGIYLKNSFLLVYGKCDIVNNSAINGSGGGIHATSSSIYVDQSGRVLFMKNRAQYGGGIYLEFNSFMLIKKQTLIEMNIESENNLFTFISNHASYGGAIYTADETNSGSCSAGIECFIQTLALYHPYNISYDIDTFNVKFSMNNATKKGSTLFGGLLDRCIPSPFAEVYKGDDLNDYTGVTYLQNISNINLDSISSKAVRICFCSNKHEPDCNYQLLPIKVRKGEAFNLSLVAVDQVNDTVETHIHSELSFGHFSEGQQLQRVRKKCTDLTFNVFSQSDYEIINLYAEGPCESNTLSTSRVTITFLDCTCPVGFAPLLNNISTECVCVCDTAISHYVECNSSTGLVTKVNTNSWIHYIDDTDPRQFVIYGNCPFDYCKPLSYNIQINLNISGGEDAQCAYNRMGTLCGVCKQNFSLSLASSSCKHCPSYWPVVNVAILLAAIVAGVLLVTAILILNITVSVGLINGFIFYANIVSAGSAVFFPSTASRSPSVVIAWLNLDIGIDVCFFDGLNAYSRTWIELAFPVYVIFLVLMVIVISEYSAKFAKLIGKRDPVSTLATLILLSYAKLLSITIKALSFANLDYPDGRRTVWLPDGSVQYFQGKHIPLALAALLIILIGLPYTILLFMWQWIVRAPRWKVFKWTRNTKLNAFISVYHVPYISKYRYWTGLLLLVRIVLYVTAAVTSSTNPQIYPLIVCVLVSSLILFKEVFGQRVYKHSLVDIVDTILYFNLLILSFFSLYTDSNDNVKKQTAVAYTSALTTLILFVGAICYHVYLSIRKKKTQSLEDSNEYILNPIQPSQIPEVTHSFIELPRPDQNRHPNGDRNQIEITKSY